MENVIGERIKELRIKKNMTQQDLADMLGNITATGVSYWENGKAKPDASVIIKLSNFFDVTIDYLYGKNDIGEGNEMYTLFRRASELEEKDQQRLKGILKLTIDGFLEDDDNESKI
jgi:Predicted transcriptional regulators